MVRNNPCKRGKIKLSFLSCLILLDLTDTFNKHSKIPFDIYKIQSNQQPVDSIDRLLYRKDQIQYLLVHRDI